MINKENLHGYYAIIQDSILKMHNSNIGWEVITNDYSFLKLGFLKKDNYLYQQINENENMTAFKKNTFCIYKNGRYEIGNVFNNKVILFPDLETKAKLGFHIYDDRSVDLEYGEFIAKAEEIWEERTPVEGFKFDVEPIFYLKRRD